MTRYILLSIAFVVLAVGAAAMAQITDPIPTPIPVGPLGIELQTVATGLVSPVYLVSPPDGSGRLFVVDQIGKVRLIKNGTLQAAVFLDVSGLITPLNAGSDERGLLGLAFHPGFADPNSPGYRTLFTYESLPTVAGSADFTVPGTASFDHQDSVVEYKVNPASPDQVDMATRRILFRGNHPFSNHNGGTIAFGSDGYLYISIGDGGGSNDSGAGHVAGGNAQDTTLALGKILRIDPLSPSLTPGSPNAASVNGQYRVPNDNPFVGVAGLDEAYAYGLRNPYRFSFDVPTGRLIAADVGQNSLEEVDIVTKGGNYGWRVKEGTFLFNFSNGTVTANSPGSPAGLIDPVIQYDHDEGDAVIGGFVYRGQQIPVFVGTYLFGDLSGKGPPPGRLFYGDLSTGSIRELTIGVTPRSLGLFLKGFGQDAQGELYVLGSAVEGPSGTQGVVLKIVRIGVPGDVNGDGVVDAQDLLLLALAFGSHTGDPNYSPAADLTGDGTVDIIDVLTLADHWPV
jgi:glucose/arabinose dehydrogenase